MSQTLEPQGSLLKHSPVGPNKTCLFSRTGGGEWAQVCECACGADAVQPQRIPGVYWWLRWEIICLHVRRPGFDPWVRKIPWSRAWQPTPLFLPGESHGQRSLAGCSPWDHNESVTTERPHTHTNAYTHNVHKATSVDWKLRHREREKEQSEGAQQELNRVFPPNTEMCPPTLPPFRLPWWAPGHSSMSTPYLLHFYLLTCLTLPELDTESQMCLVNLGANKQMTGSNCSIILTELNYISTGVLYFCGALQKLNLSTVVEDLPSLRK